MEDALKVRYEEGFEEGFKEGQRIAVMEKVARNALLEGATIEFVRKITGLDIDTITSLQMGQ
jgi:hypothetical protein